MGIALYARHRGADITVVEIDSIKALEAAMDGFDVAAPSSPPVRAELVITATGRPDVVSYETLEQLQARSLAAIVNPTSELSVGPQPVPNAVNEHVATAMLHSMGQFGVERGGDIANALKVDS